MISVKRSALGLAAFLAVCFLRFEIGKHITDSSVGTWYPTLHKAPFNPPEGFFAPVWVVLYFLMAVAGWRVWRLPRSPWRHRALVLFAIQLALNLGWSALFFGYQRIDLALAEIFLLAVLVAVTTLLFWHLDRPAGLLLLPYLLWLLFATVLVAYIWMLN